MQQVVNFLWNQYSKTYDGLLYFWPYVNLISMLKKRLSVKEGDVVLELGCGTGNILYSLLENKPSKLVGVDISKGMLSVAANKLANERSIPTQLVQSDLVSYLNNATTQSVDKIVTCNVLYAIEDQKVLWQEIIRVLKDDGLVVVTTSVRVGSFPIIKEHIKHSSFINLLRPKLLGVFLIDSLINGLGHSGHFAFHDENALRKAIEDAGGHASDFERCYGGPEEGVNIIFQVNKKFISLD